MGLLDFTAREDKMENVLFGTSKYCIPRFQRPYSWTVDHAEDFWDDLIGSVDRSSFIGPLILNEEEKSKTGFVEIIDGQQRLLTITIFVAVLRDLANELGDTKAANRYQTHCIVHEDKRGIGSVRIKCGDSTREFFQTYIQDMNNGISDCNPTKDEWKKIKKNYEYFYDKITSELDNLSNTSQKLDYIQGLLDKTYEIALIDIRIRSEEDAYEIFETTNARGVDLSTADLLKNAIFKNIKESDGEDVAKETWNEIVNNIQVTNTDLTKFIRYYWISKHEFTTEKELFRSIRKKMKDWNWDTLLKDLLIASRDYNKLCEVNESDWNDYNKSAGKICKSLLALKIMRVSQCYVLLLSLLRNNKTINSDPFRIIKMIEKFTFNYSAICGLPTNKVERMYSKYAREIEKATNKPKAKTTQGDIQRILAKLEEDLKKEAPSLETFKENFMEVSYKNSEQSRMLIKYILSEINNESEGGEHKIDFTNVNIEHILPQNPDAGWGLKKKDIKEYVNLIGNLTLVHKKINSQVSNKPIKQKIKDLSESKIAITKDLVKKLKGLKYKWNEEQIRIRQDELAESSYKVWKLK